MATDDIDRFNKEKAVERMTKTNSRNNGKGKVVALPNKILKTEKEQEDEINLLIAKNNHLYLLKIKQTLI